MIRNNKEIHFNISERKVLLRIFDLIFSFSALYFIGLFFEFDYFTISKKNWVWTVVLFLYITVFGTIFELYDLQKASKLETTVINTILTASVTVLFYLLTPFYTPILPENRMQILFFYIAILVAILFWRLLYINFISTPRFYKKVLLVGDVSNIESIINAFNSIDPNYKIIGYINCKTENKAVIKLKNIKEFEPNQIHEVIASESVSEIVVASYNPESITPSIYSDLITLLESGFSIREYTQVFEEFTQRVPVQFIGKDFYRYSAFNRSNHNKLYSFFHRFFDLFFSFFGLLFCIVLFPIILIGNLLANRGSLFYTQERIGLYGKPFYIIKFRTMIKNAEKDGAVWASKNDKRVTYFGKFLRLTRLDELPQFINVLKGDMSLIGPRPERPYFVSQLTSVIPFYETRHIIKPGITGWAQVKVRYGTTVDDSLLKLQYDLYYIKHRSFFLDAKIIIKTLSTMIYFRGQ